MTNKQNPILEETVNGTNGSCLFIQSNQSLRVKNKVNGSNRDETVKPQLVVGEPRFQTSKELLRLFKSPGAPSKVMEAMPC